MSSIPLQQYQTLSRIKLFLALSRTHHGLLDLATPGLGALLWLGGLPSLETAVLGVITAFAGYTAVYALNDVVDYHSDQRKIHASVVSTSAKGLDGVYVRHPLAYGLLTLRDALIWTGGWSFMALAGAFALNPVCAIIFLASCALEAAYCLLLRVTHLRTVMSGVVKTAGGVAAVFAVDPNPEPLFLLTFFLVLFFWEIGGQNVPSDWADLEEDRKTQSKTLPGQLGLEKARTVIITSLGVATGLSVSLFWFTRADLSAFYLLGTLAAGVYLLLVPAYRLYRTTAVEAASQLFSRASYYPLALLGIVIVSFLT